MSPRHRDRYKSQARKAQKERAHLKQCEGKLRFSQHRRAAARAGRNQYAYECQVCGGWHLATDPLRRLVDRLAMVRRDRRGAA